MQTEKREKKLVVILIVIYKIIKYQCKKDNHNAGQCRAECLPKFYQSRTAVNIFVKSGDIINCDPENGDQKQSDKKTIVKFNGDINAKTLGFNNGFPIYKKYNPTYCRG